MAWYRPFALMSASMPDRRRVSLAPVNTLAPSGIRSLTRVRAAAASSRISAVKPWAVSAAAARSRPCPGAGSANSVAGIGVVMVPPGLVVGVADGKAQVVPNRRGPGRGRGDGGFGCQPEAPSAADVFPAGGLAGAPAARGAEPASGVVSRYLTSYTRSVNFQPSPALPPPSCTPSKAASRSRAPGSKSPTGHPAT